MRLTRLFVFLLFLLLALILAVGFFKNRAGEEEMRARLLKEQLHRSRAAAVVTTPEPEAKPPRLETVRPQVFVPPPPDTSRRELDSIIKELTILVKKQNRMIESLVAALNYYKKAASRTIEPVSAPVPPLRPGSPAPVFSPSVMPAPPPGRAPSRWTTEDEQRYRQQEAQKLKARQELDREILQNTRQLKAEAQKYDKYFQDMKPREDFKEMEKIKGRLQELN